MGHLGFRNGFFATSWIFLCNFDGSDVFGDTAHSKLQEQEETTETRARTRTTPSGICYAVVAFLLLPANSPPTSPESFLLPCSLYSDTPLNAMPRSKRMVIIIAMLSRTFMISRSLSTVNEPSAGTLPM